MCNLIFREHFVKMLDLFNISSSDLNVSTDGENNNADEDWTDIESEDLSDVESEEAGETERSSQEEIVTINESDNNNAVKELTS